ncbi:alpha/beta hydrolase [Azoarcus sp. DD4]|uniref:alpha/beta fold hydrolase n=1 Tax=Azoarcus sp. DD4 TaxID=2027405 RepID=UPI0011268298|nr:alpha/beta hydrolase [Azoarcus sp. DD4]QDF98026.1 alpha/beta hydrolase [Azoarcus sp. DD4]
MERRDYTLPHAGLNLHVTEWGPADGRPVVMLHGIRGYGETFAGVAAALQPAFRVIAFDQRGRGRSDWDPHRNYYTDTYVGDLLAVADTLDLARFDLLGHSMGGINAIVFASQYPERVGRLVIEDAGPGAFDTSPGATRIRGELVSTPAHFDSWEAAGDFMRGLRPSVTEAARQQRLASMLKPADGGGYTWRYDHAGIAATRLNPELSRLVDLRPHVAALQCDTLVLRGSRTDYLQPAMLAEMQRLNPRIADIEIAGAGHYIHDDQPEAFNRAVRAFLLPSAPAAAARIPDPDERTTRP